MKKKYIVKLTENERLELDRLTRKGKVAAYKIKHAHVLLQADANGPNWTDEKIAQSFRCHVNTVHCIRKRFVELGLEVALERKKQDKLSREKILDGEKEARLIAISCSKPPKGHAKWTLKLLSEELVVLDIVDSIFT